jgi:sarcosine oxidase subunit beta
MGAACDHLIVGGGVVGAAAAFHLAGRRAGRVVLLEKAFAGAGASGKAAAPVRPHDATPLTAALARWGLQVYESFPEQVGGPPVLTRTGTVLVAPEADRAALEAAAVGDATARLVTGQELAEIDPNLRLADDEAAAFDPAAGHVDAVQVVNAYAEAARRHGADLRQGVEVQAVVADRGRVSGVETNEGFYACGHLVLAAGPWAAGLLRPLKVSLPVQPCRTQVALFRRPPDFGRRGPACVDFVQGLYFRPSQAELIRVGGLGDDAPPADPDDYDEAPAGDWLSGVRQRLRRRYPALHRAYGRGGYAAVYGRTPDRHPVVDRPPGWGNLTAAAGFGGHGFLLAPAVGQLIAEWVLDGKASSFDPAPLRLARFDEGDPVRPASPYGLLG